LLWAGFRADNREVVAVGRSGVVSVWQLPNTVEVLPGNAGEDPAAGGPRQVALDSGITVRVQQARSAGPLLPPLSGEQLVEQAVFSPDGSRVVVRDENGTARLWDTTNGKPLHSPLRHGGAVHYAAFSADGTRLLTAARDRTVRVWDAARGEGLGPALKHSAAIERVWFRGGGDQAVVACAGGAGTTWDLTPTSESVDELLALARVLACGRIEEHQEQKALEMKDLRAAWQELQAAGVKEKWQRGRRNSPAAGLNPGERK
jgi:WD40 repeat protein